MESRTNSAVDLNNQDDFTDSGLCGDSNCSQIPGSPPATKYEKGENRRMIRNVIVLSLAFTLLFTSYKGMANLQSSINSEGGLGNWASAVTYAALIISALFLPTAVIKKMTAKWTIFISIIGYIIFIAAQFYPSFATLVPASAIVGFCAAPLWSAKCCYVSHLGREYALATSSKPELTIVRFFSLFFMIFSTNGLFGNLLSSIILSSTFSFSSSNDSSLISTSVESTDAVKFIPGHCGANYCPGILTSIKSGSVEQSNGLNIKILAGVYILIALLSATAIGLFLDSLKRYGEVKSESSTKSLLIATFRQMTKKYQLLLIPLTMWAGLQQGFLGADYTAAFITCGWGVENVGYVLICYGVFNVFSAMCYPHLVKYLGRVIVFFMGATLSTGLITCLLIWQPNPDGTIYFFIFAGLWGVADSFWQCGINAYYGVLFQDNVEASFSNYRVWESLGYLAAFIVANLICVRVKLFLLLCTLVVGMVGFSIIEICERRKLSKGVKD